MERQYLFLCLCLDHPLACLARLAPCRPLSAWGLGQVDCLAGWNWQSYQVEVLAFCRLFGHSFEQISFLCLDVGHLASLSSLVCHLKLSWLPQFSCTSWPCIACHPLSLGHFCRWEKKLSRLEFVGKSSDQDLIVGLINQKHFFVELSHIWPQALILLLLNVQQACRGPLIPLPIKWVMKCPLNSLKVERVLGAILLNHTLIDFLSVVGNTLHMISYTWRFWTTLDGRVGPLIDRTPPLVASSTWPKERRRWLALWRVNRSNGVLHPGWWTLTLS